MKDIALKIFRSNYFIWPIVGFTLLSAGVLLYFSSVKEKIIFPSTGDYTFEPYTDGANGGNSEVTDYIFTDSILTLGFLLKDGFQSPYVGLDIIPQHDDYIDISAYNQLEIEVLGENIERIGISLYTPPLQDGEIVNTNETLYTTNLNISNQKLVYKIPITRFQHPDWWEDQNHIPANLRNKPDLGKILHLNLGSAYSPQVGNEKAIHMYSISFSRNNTQLFLILGLLYLLSWVLTFGIIYVWKYGFKTKNVLVTYNPLEIKNNSDNGHKCLEYINAHYSDGDLTLEVVSKETGVSTRHITHLIHEEFGLNFKTYINQIRINESKRFLMQSDLNMGEIAFKVGFNNQSHFNRVFKKEMDVSPTEFRNNHSKA